MADVQDRRRILARRYLFQLGDAVDSLLQWNLKSLLEPVREALSSVQKQRFETLERSLADLSTSISDLTTSPNGSSVVALLPSPSTLTARNPLGRSGDRES